jgi:hypothetical protein
VQSPGRCRAEAPRPSTPGSPWSTHPGRHPRAALRRPCAPPAGRVRRSGHGVLTVGWTCCSSTGCFAADGEVGQTVNSEGVDQAVMNRRLLVTLAFKGLSSLTQRSRPRSRPGSPTVLRNRRRAARRPAEGTAHPSRRTNSVTSSSSSRCCAMHAAVSIRCSVGGETAAAAQSPNFRTRSPHVIGASGLPGTGAPT